MGWARVTILTVIAAILQVSLLGSLRVFGVVPNLVLALLVGLVVWRTASEALLAAVAAGLIFDVVGAGLFGLATSSLVVICLGLIALRQLGVDGQAWPTRLGLVALATIIWGVIHLAALGSVNVVSWLGWRTIILEVAVNSVVALCITERLVNGTRTV